MRVRMLVLAAGPDGVHAIGSVREVDDEEAKALLAGGYADAVDAPTDATASRKGRGRRTPVSGEVTGDPPTDPVDEVTDPADPDAPQ